MWPCVRKGARAALCCMPCTLCCMPCSTLCCMPCTCTDAVVSARPIARASRTLSDRSKLCAPPMTVAPAHGVSSIRWRGSCGQRPRARVDCRRGREAAGTRDAYRDLRLRQLPLMEHEAHEEVKGAKPRNLLEWHGGDWQSGRLQVHVMGRRGKPLVSSFQGGGQRAARAP